MPTYEASRISGNDNVVFPDRLEIDEDNGNITFFKGTIVGYRQSFLARNNVASVRIASGLLFADIIIESTGGKEIRVSGLRKRDAREIMELLSDA
jgi:hypothetical protein